METLPGLAHLLEYSPAEELGVAGRPLGPSSLMGSQSLAYDRNGPEIKQVSDGRR